MLDEKNFEVQKALFSAVMGELIASYAERIPPAIISQAMESRAIRTLEAIRRVLNDDSYSDPECYERVDALVMTFFKETGINTDRHGEQD